MMKAECPHCQTIFKLTEEQLKIAEGMVRCGMCQNVFNALQNIDDPFDEDTDTVLEPEKNVDKEPVIPPVEKAIESLAATLNRNKPSQQDSVKDFSQALHGTSNTESNNEFEITTPRSEEKNINEELFEGIQSKLIPDEYRIPELKTPYSVWKDISWSLAILLFTASLFVEYAWFNRLELAAKPQLKDWVTKICNFTDCQGMGIRYPKEIEMVSRNIYSHPNVKNALMISLTMVNHASFAQPFPNIKIDFSDVRGDTVASRIFLPEEYLQLKKKSLRLLPIGTSTDISLEIKDPGATAMTYEFNFL